MKDKLVLFFYFLVQLPLIFLIRLMGFQKIKSHFISKITIKNRDGIFYCSNLSSYQGIVREDYEEELKNISLDKGVFVDIGANIGKYTIRFGNLLKNNGQVISIEPEPFNFRILKKNIELNNLGNVILKNIACSDKNGEIDFYILEKGSGGHSAYKKEGKKIKVKTQKLDDIVKELGINRVDLIKIDVEGWENHVLLGGLNILSKYHPKIIFEAWDEKKLEKIKKILKKFRYKIRKLDNQNNYYAFL